MPIRFVHGDGLSAAFVASMQPTPQLIVTVDNGVASVAGVAAAKARGIRVIVTDHHLPGEQLPACDAMVNPNLAGDPFPSKMLAGVGRSEEHTSELTSLMRISYAVFCLKKN